MNNVWPRRGFIAGMLSLVPLCGAAKAKPKASLSDPSLRLLQLEAFNAGFAGSAKAANRRVGSSVSSSLLP